MGNPSKIFGTGWKDGDCKSCGGGGGDSGPSWWQPVAIIVVITWGGWLMSMSGWLANRGTRISDVSCQWDAQEGVYRARFMVHNEESNYKILSVTVQGRFHPQPGQKWPHPMVRREYEAKTHLWTGRLGPQAQREGTETFSIPGAKDFACKARVDVNQQEKFSEDPEKLFAI